MTTTSAPFPSAVESGAGEPASADRLRAYTRLKLDLAAQTRLLRVAVRLQGDERRAGRCDELMVKLAEDRFTLAVLGQFKRGKSSLMNSVIGRELLPVGVLPLTSAITVLRYGPSERLLIQRRHWSMQEEKPVDKLADYVTERGNPGNREQVSAAYVELPVPFLRRGLEFVDTPGVGSSIAANTATTYDFLPRCDAVLFVTSADAPLNRVELEFLGDVRRHAAKMFFVVNKMDLLGEAERTEVLEFVRTALREQAGIGAPRVFPVSALQGLAAKQRGDEALFTQSGLADLESALAEFLTHQKGAVFLASILDKTEHLLEAARVEDEIGRRSRLAPGARQAEGGQKMEEELRRLRGARDKMLEAGRAQFLGRARAGAAQSTDAFLRGRQEGLMRHFQRLLKHGGLASGRSVFRRLGRAAERLAGRALRRDLERALSQSLREAAQISDQDRRELASNVAGIFQAAIAMHGIAAVAKEDAELLPPLRDPSAHLALPSPPRWNPGLPAGLAWLPARWCRARLAEASAARAAAWSGEWRRRLEQAVAVAAGRAFEDWTSEVAATVASIEGLVRPGATDHPLKNPAATRATLAAIQQRLLRLREAVARMGEGESPADPDQAEMETVPEIREFATPVSDRGGRPERPAAKKVAADLAIRGCSACAHLANVNADFMAGWQHRLYSSEAAQREFADELGFCSRHQWQLEAISSPMGLSVGQAKLVRRVGLELTKASRQPAGERSLDCLVPSARACRVCQRQDEAERSYLARLAELVRQPAGREAYACSQGLCLRHLTRLLAVLADDEAARFVLACAGKRWSELAEDMESYGMKTEALRRQLRNSDEEDAYWRANVLLAGSRSLCQPWPTEDFL